MKKYILTPLAGIVLLLMGLLFACDDQEAPHNTAPVLTTGSVEVGGRTTATLSGTIAFPDETEVTECGFIYSTVSTLPEEESTVVPVNVSQLPGTLSVELTGLQPATHYYYCLYASSGYTVLRSEIKEFDTAADGVPTFGEVTYTNVTETTADVTCRLTDDGGYDILTLGFCYKPVEEGESDAPSQEDFVVNVKEDAITLTATLTHLTPDQLYAVCAYGTNQEGVGYSEPVTFTTKQSVIPTTETGEAADITETSATLTGTLSSSTNVTEHGFYLSDNVTDLFTDHAKIVVDTDAESFIYQATNLTPSTTYYYCTYAVSNDEMLHGEVEMFTTLAEETEVFFNSPAAYDVTSSSATLSVTFNNETTPNITEAGFCYKIWDGNYPTDQPTIEDDKIVCTVEGKRFSATLTELPANTYFFYRAYAIVNGEVSYSQVNDFKTTISEIPGEGDIDNPDIDHQNGNEGGEETPEEGDIDNPDIDHQKGNEGGGITKTPEVNGN